MITFSVVRREVQLEKEGRQDQCADDEDRRPCHNFENAEAAATG